MPNRQTALAIAAHPDDIEFVMSGTLLLLKNAGYEIHYLNIANGCCGSSEHDAERTAAIRAAEAQAAAALIGARWHASLVNDLEIFYDLPTLSRAAAIVREVAPEIVLTHSPVDYMVDHENACRLAVTATFARGMANFKAAPLRPPTTQPVAVYHAQPHGNRDPVSCGLVQPRLFVDVGGVMPLKRQMLACHRSQSRWLAESQAMDSYLQAMETLLAEVGRLSGRFAYAEGWRRRSHLGFSDAGFDPLSDALGAFVAQA